MESQMPGSSTLQFRDHDWYKSEMTEHHPWMANSSEYRLILIAAAFCLFVVIVALLWPQPDQQPTSFATEGKQTFTIPPKPVTVKSQPPAQAIRTPPKAEPVVRPAVSPKSAREIRNISGHGYFIQAGAFQDPARAKKRQSMLRTSGWNVSIVNKGKGLHAVWLGPWSSRAEADRAKSRLIRIHKIQGFIIRK